MSSLREAYLKLLAAETGLDYHRLQTAEGLLGALTSESLARETPSQADLRYGLAGLALLTLLAVYLAGPLRRGVSRLTSTLPNKKPRHGRAGHQASSCLRQDVNSLE